jgi:hypothetical protein
MSPKPTPDELEKLLGDFAKEEEWSGLDTLSDEEREAKLAASGIDRERARAMGEATFEAAKAAEAARPASVISFDDRRAKDARPFLSRWGGRLSLAAGLLLLVGLAWVRGVFDPEPTITTSPIPVSSEDIARQERHGLARSLVREASDDLLARRYLDALRKLDDAKALDPTTEDDPEVQQLRKDLATHGVGSAPPK